MQSMDHLPIKTKGWQEMKTGRLGGAASSLRAAFYSGAAVLAFTMPGVALAQQEEEALPATDIPEQEAVGNDIVVTANKREQTLQDVPVAVSVTSAETLERAHIRDISDLSSVVPSLRVVGHQSSAQTDFLIRGFGNGANNAGVEPSVGVFIDGVYRSRSAAQISDFPDTKRVEVLRGPQSTLFGKNASVGVISIITQEPQFDFGGNFEASYGNYNAVVVKGRVTGPISDNVAASLSGGYNRRDGTYYDAGTGNRTNERNRWFLKGQLLFKDDDGLKVRLIGDYGEIDENCCAVVNIRSSSATTALQALGAKVNLPGDAFAGTVYNNFDSSNKIKNYGVSAQVDYEFGPLTATSITAWRHSGALTAQDSDFTTGDLLGVHDEDLRINTFTQEFRISANFVDRVNALLGVYYFNEKIDQHNVLQWGGAARPYFDLLIRGLTGGAGSLYTITPGTTPLEPTFGALEGNPAKYAGQFFANGQGLDERYWLKNEAISVFSQIDFKVTDRMTLTGGINFTHDGKKVRTQVTSSDVFARIDINAPQYAPLRVALLQGLFGYSQAQAIATQATPALVAANNPLTQLRALQIFPQFLNIPNMVEDGKTSDSNVSYTARLAYDATDHVNVYASFATGFKASSINLSRDSRPSEADRNAIVLANLARINQTYGSRFAGPEKSTVYEAGVKANWRMASANLAVFKQIIRGFQSNTFNGIGFLLSNAGRQSTFGVEFEGVVRPVGGLSLGAAVTYLDPKYDSYLQSPFGDASGVRPSGIPEWSMTFSADWEHGFANDDKLILHADYHHESKVQILDGLPAIIQKHPLNGSVVSYQAALDTAKLFTREVNELNASITYAMHNGLELSVWGRNITNDRYLFTIFDSPAQTGSVSGYPNQPRTYGGTVRYKF